MGFESAEKAGELLVDFGLEKINEYKTEEEWKALFVDTDEFIVQNFERADKLFNDMAIVMSKTNMIELAKFVKIQIESSDTCKTKLKYSRKVF